MPLLILGGMISWNGTPKNEATWLAIAVSAPCPLIKTAEPIDMLEEFFW